MGTTPNPTEGSATTAPSLRRRLVIALGIGLFAAVASWLQTHRSDFGAPADFHGVWYAAAKLVAGENPYNVGMIFYPLPAFIAVVPFTIVPVDVATSLFSGCTSALLAFVVTRESFVRLPMFLSAGFAHGAVQGQWSMLLTAGVLSSRLSFVGAIKPNIGLAILAYRPTVRTAAAMLAFVAVSLVVMPSWPRDWLANFEGSPAAGTPIHTAPVATTIGFLGLLALLRWRRPEARLLTAMLLVPQSPFTYEVLPLFAVARTRFETYALVIGTDIALAYYALAPSEEMVAYFRGNANVIFLTVYLPALFLVLRRPNEGEVPAWLERRVAALPAWIRGRKEPLV